MRVAQGFTLIELVLVIVLLGILSASALPKFIDLRSAASEAAVSGVAGAFTTSISLARAKLIVANASTEADVLGTTVYFYTDGDDTSASATTYPASSNAGGHTAPAASGTAFGAADCVAVWQALLDSNSPSVSAAAGSDYLASQAGGVCTFKEQESGLQEITYNPTSGVVVVQNQ